MEKTFSRQSSMSSDASPPRSLPATSSPHHRRNDSASLPGGSRRRQNAAARAAAQRMARAMASTETPESSGDEEDLDDDLSSVHSFDMSTPRRSSIRSSISQASFESTTPRRRTASQASIDLPLSRHRTPSPAMGRYLNEQTGVVRSTTTGRATTMGRPSTLIPPSRQTLRPATSSSASYLPALPTASRREKGMSFDLGHLDVKEEVRPTSSSDLQDEIDVLQEQNDNMLQKLREAEEKCEVAESKAQQLEKKVSFLGDRTSNGIHGLSRKGTILRQTSANEGDTCTPKNDMVKSELRSLRKMVRRMILCQEEKEEMILKRCWLAHYWKLSKQYGIYADLADEKSEYWSSLVSDPLETMLSAGQKARDDTSADKIGIEEDKHMEALDMNYNKDTEGNLLNMILVEKGMRELASLKVEDAVLIAMSQSRFSHIKNLSDAEGQSPRFALDLSEEEREDVQFKQAWLAYYWRRAKDHGIEEDIAEERLQFWIQQSNHSPNAQDALEVERGLHELKKLGIESLLWEVTREGIELVDSLAESEE